MARFAITQRPPVLSSLCLLAAALLLEPGPGRVVSVAPDPLGPSLPCLASGVWHGDFYVPTGLWSMPVLHPQGHWRMPTITPDGLAPVPNVLAPGAVIPLGHWDSNVEADALRGPADQSGKMIDVDRLVSGFKQLLSTPAT